MGNENKQPSIYAKVRKVVSHPQEIKNGPPWPKVSPNKPVSNESYASNEPNQF
jgi:hypothetical protein